MNTTKLTIPLCVALSLGSSQVMAVPIISELGSYAVLALTTISSTGPNNTISGNLGVFPGTAVTGTINYTSGRLADPVEAGAVAPDNDALGVELVALVTPSASIPISSDLNGMTFAPGIYSTPTTMEINNTLTLDGLGDPNAQWIFRSVTTLTVGAGAKVQIVNTGTSEGVSVFWSVGTAAVLNENSDFLGNIVAKTAITLASGANISCGRVFAGTAITMQGGNTISRDCLDMDNQGLQYSAGLSGGTGGRLPTSSDPIYVSQTIAPEPSSVAVPEPSTLAIFALGLMGLASRRFKKQA